MRKLNLREHVADDQVILWSAIKDDLPPLVPRLRSILAREPDATPQDD
jgi:hypothetical protein